MVQAAAGQPQLESGAGQAAGGDSVEVGAKSKQVAAQQGPPDDQKCEICRDSENTIECTNCGMFVHESCYGQKETVAKSSGDCLFLCFRCGGNPPTNTKHEKLGGFRIVGQREYEFDMNGQKVLRKLPTCATNPDKNTLPEVFLRGTHLGLGVFANEFLPKGTIVAEYTGEVIDNAEGRKRRTDGKSSHVRKLDGSAGSLLDGSIRKEKGYTLEHYVDITGDVGSLFNSFQDLSLKKTEQTSKPNCYYWDSKCKIGKGKCHVIPNVNETDVVRTVPSSTHVYLRTRIAVHKGKQLFTNYGNDYFDGGDCEKEEEKEEEEGSSMADAVNEKEELLRTSPEAAHPYATRSSKRRRT